MDTRPRAFQVRTQEGSKFAFRFDPQIEDARFVYGTVTIIGYSVMAESHVTIHGMGCAPEAGGRIIVSQQPLHYEWLENGERLPIYQTETILVVREVPVPDELLTPTS
jgi:hypothetical protein